MTHFQTADGDPVTLSEKIGSGGEGDVYRIQSSYLLAKLFKQPNAELHQKLDYMISHPPKSKASLAWPQQMIFNEQGNFTGYTMRHIEGYPLCVVHHPKDRRELLPDWNVSHLLTTAIHLCKLLHSLHRENIIIGDFSDTNVMVDLDQAVFIIDCDSFQISAYHCKVRRTEIQPPENIGTSKPIHTQYQDDYSLAILLFFLLC